MSPWCPVSVRNEIRRNRTCFNHRRNERHRQGEPLGAHPVAGQTRGPGGALDEVHERCGPADEAQCVACLGDYTSDSALVERTVRLVETVDHAQAIRMRTLERVELGPED